jgi:dihydrofolate reductase
MRKLVVGAFLSLDGVMQAPGGPDEDREGGYDHGGWTAPHFDDQLGQIMTDLVSRASALLLGRKTYDVFAASWPLAAEGDPIGTMLNSMPKYVASRTLDTVKWQNSTLLTGDVAQAVADLKRQPGGEIHTSGSANLVQTLIRHDLVDEFVLLTFPVVLGPGKRLFGEGTVPRGLRLLDSTTLSTGVTITSYERGGEVEVGTMAVAPE